MLGRRSCLRALVVVRRWALFVVGARCRLSPFRGGGWWCLVRDPRSWAVGFAGRRLSLFVGCGSFVAVAVVCGVVVREGWWAVVVVFGRSSVADVDGACGSCIVW